MQIEYEKSCTNEYMVIDISNEYSDGFVEKMLLRADIPGLLNVDKRFFNGSKKYYYDISSYICLLDYYEERRISEKEIILILSSISEIYNTLAKYLLDGSNIIISPDCIYKKVNEEKLAFCFFPGFKEQMHDAINEFAVFLLDHIDNEGSMGVGLAYEYYEMIMNGKYDPNELIIKYQSNIQGEEATIDNDKESEITNSDETFYFAMPSEAEEIDDNREILFPLTVCAVIILVSSMVYVYVFMHPKLLNKIGLAQESYVIIGAAMAFFLSILLFFIVKVYVKKTERKELETEAVQEIEYKRRMRQGKMEKEEYERKKLS